MKIRGRSKKSSLFFKYLLSYMLILCIPLVITGIFIFGYFNRILENELNEGNLSMLRQINNVVDSQVLEFNKISNQIFNNYKLKPHALNKSTYAKMEAIQELKNYSIGNDFIHNLSLYVKNTNFIISAAGTYDAPNFINFAYNYENWEYDDFIRDVNELQKPAFRYSENVYTSSPNCSSRLITYMVPGSQSTAIFMIDENKLKNMMTLKNARGYENTIIADKDANIVASVYDWPFLYSEAFSGIICNTGEKGTGIAEIQDIGYFYSYVKSTITGWIFVTMIPERVALMPVFNVRQIAICAWVLIVVLGSLIIYIITNYNYNPLLDLRKLAEEKLGQHMDGRNEIQVVESVINRMADNGMELKKTLNNSKLALKESLLLDLLKGRFESAVRFNSMGKDIGLCITKPVYNVSIFYSKQFKDMNNNQKAVIINEIEDLMPEGVEGYGRDGIAEGTIIFVIAMGSHDADLLKSVLQNIKNTMSNKHGFNITIGAGSSCDAMGQVGRSYLEAVTAIDYKFILGENKIIFFNEIVIKGSGNIKYPEKELKDIQIYIKQGNIECIENALNTIVKGIKESDMPIVIARCICFDIINSVLKVVNETGLSAIMADKDYFNIEDLNHFNTPEELTDIIIGVCTDLCGEIRKSKESRNFSLKEKLIQYIEKNCDDQNFCVKSMADDFGMSQSYLSRFFKDQTGQTLSEYQLYLRMEKAKYYLKSTNEPIRNIVSMIGYCNEASFVRLFKKMEGITPGEFRKLSQSASHRAPGLI